MEWLTNGDQSFRVQCLVVVGLLGVLRFGGGLSLSLLAATMFGVDIRDCVVAKGLCETVRCKGLRSGCTRKSLGHLRRSRFLLLVSPPLVPELQHAVVTVWM